MKAASRVKNIITFWWKADKKRSDMFNSRVKKTSQLFQATTDLGADGMQCHVAALPLVKDRTYMGHLFVDGMINANNPGIVKCTRVQTEYFEGDELEPVSIDKIRIVRGKTPARRVLKESNPIAPKTNRCQ